MSFSRSYGAFRSLNSESGKRRKNIVWRAAVENSSSIMVVRLERNCCLSVARLLGTLTEKEWSELITISCVIEN
ncbi:unnamed protein product [Rhodiola kirilowii]